jgi:hypothetical protein
MKSFPVNSIRSRLAAPALPVSLLFTVVPLAGAYTLHTGVGRSEVWDAPVSPTTEVCVDDDIAPAAAPLMEATASRKIIVASGSIEAAVAEFRALLGNPNNGAATGEQPAGRREINWDGVPVGLTNTTHFPEQFFNGVSPRGLVYQQGLRGLEVSDNSFININPAYAGEFLPFSGQKMFSPLGTNESDVLFFVAGTHIEAAVSGFGIVFSDVDKDDTTGIKLLDENDVLLETVLAPARTDARGLSFVGVVFRKPIVTHVHIVAGDARLGLDEIDVTQGGLHDLVVMDDFIYGEPKAVGQ